MKKYTRKEIKEIRKTTVSFGIVFLLFNLAYLFLFINYHVGYFHLSMRKSAFLMLIVGHILTGVVFVTNYLTLRKYNNTNRKK